MIYKSYLGKNYFTLVVLYWKTEIYIGCTDVIKSSCVVLEKIFISCTGQFSILYSLQKIREFPTFLKFSC